MTFHGRLRRVFGLAALVGLGALAGCAATDRGMDGDCTADLRFHGTRYEVRSDLDGVRVGPTLGAADVVACATDDDTVLGHADVYPVTGVDPDTAIATVDTWKNGKKQVYVYVRESLPRTETPSSWPSGSTDGG